MKKSIAISLCFLVIISVLFCGKQGTNEQQITSYFRGTVYLNGEPVANTRVRIQLRDSSKYIGGLTWSETKEVTTDENGEFELEFIENISEPHGWTWQASAMHPETGYWTDWVLGGTVTQGESGAGTLTISIND